MKRLKSAAIIFALLFLMCGCSHSEPATTVQTQTVPIVQTKTTISPATTLYPITTQTTTNAETTTIYTTGISETAVENTSAQSNASNPLEDLMRSFLDLFERFTRPGNDNDPADVTAVTTSKSITTKAETTEKRTTEKKTTEKKTTKSTTAKRETTQKQTTQRVIAPSLQTEYATLTISVINIKNNISLLPREKRSFVPKSGYILKEQKVELSDGDTAFDVLRKGCEKNVCTDGCVYCKMNSIQLEYSFTAAYNSYYVEGIHQLYEKDCGAVSGWIYQVNGVVPETSSSNYQVKDGDRITYVYTCDGGNDI